MAGGAFAAFLAVALFSLVSTAGAVTNFCALNCVRDIYRRSCGGATCITSVANSRQFRGLCAVECTDALNTAATRDCLATLDGDAGGGAPTNLFEIQSMIISAVDAFCDGGDPFAEVRAPPPSAPIVVPPPPLAPIVLPPPPHFFAPTPAAGIFDGPGPSEEPAETPEDISIFEEPQESPEDAVNVIEALAPSAFDTSGESTQAPQEAPPSKDAEGDDTPDEEAPPPEEVPIFEDPPLEIFEDVTDEGDPPLDAPPIRLPVDSQAGPPSEEGLGRATESPPTGVIASPPSSDPFFPTATAPSPDEDSFFTGRKRS